MTDKHSTTNAPQPSAEGRRVAWLIERKTADGVRWYVEDERERHDWTPDANFATSFATKAKAEDFPSYRMIATDPDISITEHVFIGAQPSAALPGKDVGELPGVDSQVMTAAAQMTDGQKRQPEWLWFGDEDDGGVSFGRWQIAPGQAPYIRADLVSALVSQPQPEGEVVGYLFELRYSEDHWSGRMFSEHLPTNKDDVRNVRPLGDLHPTPTLQGAGLIEAVETLRFNAANLTAEEELSDALHTLDVAREVMRDVAARLDAEISK